MPDIQVDVRQAQIADIERIQHLQQHARRSCIRFGREDLARMIERDYCFIADTGPMLWGFFCATQRQPGLALVRGLGLVNGWRVDTGLQRLLQPLETALLSDNIRHLMHMGMESWTVSSLTRQNFNTPDYIINYERATPIHPLLPEHHSPIVYLRMPAADEISELTWLDHRTFPWPWQFSRGELVQLLMTCSRLVVLDYQGILAGYACTDLHGTNAQIIRIAIDPVYRGMGFGRYLLADALDFAAEMGARTVTLNTQRQNQASQNLYQGFGFRAVGRRIPVMIKNIGDPPPPSLWPA